MQIIQPNDQGIKSDLKNIYTQCGIPQNPPVQFVIKYVPLRLMCCFSTLHALQNDYLLMCVQIMFLNTVLKLLQIHQMILKDKWILFL